MIPYGHQSIDEKDVEEVVRILKSDWLTQGPKVSEFEKALTKYCGAKYAVAVSSGTAALHLAYLAADLNKSEIITTANTFAATTNMMLAAGAKPVFCDIRLDTYNIDEKKIASLVNRKTKAIVPVHFAGQPCEMDFILNIARKYKLLIIEDACHALGSSYKTKNIGGLKSDMAVFSFHPVKSITTGEGGAILTDKSFLYEKLVRLRSHGIIKDRKGFNVMTDLGYNYRLTDIQAALGISQLVKLPGFLKERWRLAGIYFDELSGIKGIILPARNPASSWHLFVIRTTKAIDRLPLYDHLKKKGIGVNFHYPAVYSHPYYRKNGFSGVSLANTETFADSAITIPLHVELKSGEIHFIAKNIRDFF